jgi:hypothetical protein
MIASLVFILSAAIASVQAPLWRVFALASTASLLLVPHVYLYDATMLLLPVWCGMFLSHSRFTAIAAATLCMPVLPSPVSMGLHCRPPRDWPYACFLSLARAGLSRRAHISRIPYLIGCGLLNTGHPHGMAIPSIELERQS